MCGSSGLGIGFPGLEGCVSQEVGVGSRGWAQQLEGLLPQPLPPPLVLAVTSPEAFPDGTEVLGGLDSKYDAGDQEKRAPPQAEPEGVLGRRMWGQHTVLGAAPSQAARHPQPSTDSTRGTGTRPQARGEGPGCGLTPPPPEASPSTSPGELGQDAHPGVSHHVTQDHTATVQGWGPRQNVLCLKALACPRSARSKCLLWGDGHRPPSAS